MSDVVSGHHEDCAGSETTDVVIIIHFSEVDFLNLKISVR